MGVISLIMALGLLPFHLYLHHLRANAKLSYQRISKPSSQILLSSIRCPSLPVPSTDIRKHTREKPIAKPHPPDFVHVLSLKGLFLYVAPSIRNVLGFEADELVGKSIAEYCHPADLVPLMRELNESSVPDTVTGSRRTVDLLFPVRSKLQGYVWVESGGRLHVEPGKGRKAIILNGGVRSMPMMRWVGVVQGGGIVPALGGGRRVAFGGC